jgi:acyl-coenzyme A thioesterase PaaI-like protein
MNWSPRKLRFMLNLYPPYLGAGIRTTHVDSEWRELRVEMKLRWFNKNAVGTQFGGSLYSMVDPHLMLLLMQRLGRDYVVWDKSATIDFRKPGTGVVRAVIRVTDEQVEAIRRATADDLPHRPEFDLEIRDGQDQLVASVHKVLHVRRRQVTDRG